MKRLLIIAIALATYAVCGCAPGGNPLTNSYGNGSNAGFWIGLWQGMICPIALVISWFNSSVSIYEVHNNGGWYNTGFVFGAGAWGCLGFGRSSTGSVDLSEVDDEDLLEEVRERGLLASHVVGDDLDDDDLDLDDDDPDIVDEDEVEVVDDEEDPGNKKRR